MNEETLLDKVIISVMFIAFLVAMACMPDVFSNDPVGYDCRLASYPSAVDVPPMVVKACREQQKEQYASQKRNS